MPAVRLLIQVPDVGSYMLAAHKFPVLVYTDPPDATVTASVEAQAGDTIAFAASGAAFGPFTQIVWVDGLPQDKCRVVDIVATKAGLDPGGDKCSLRRHSPVRVAAGGPPEIAYPTSPPPPVSTNFPAYGYIDPPTTTVVAWLVDASNNTYPGMMMPPGLYNWCFGFQNIPNGSYTLYVQTQPGGNQASVSVTVQSGPPVPAPAPAAPLAKRRPGKPDVVDGVPVASANRSQK
jgi:hypothetical protein